jgi:hypothetical protein
MGSKASAFCLYPQEAGQVEGGCYSFALKAPGSCVSTTCGSRPPLAWPLAWTPPALSEVPRAIFPRFNDPSPVRRTQLKSLLWQECPGSAWTPDPRPLEAFLGTGSPHVKIGRAGGDVATAKEHQRPPATGRGRVSALNGSS